MVLEKRRGEGLGVALVESGWGSLLPTAVIASLLLGGPAERSGALSIGDRLTAINGTSLVGLPLATVQAAIRVSPCRVAGFRGPGPRGADGRPRKGAARPPAAFSGQASGPAQRGHARTFKPCVLRKTK